MVIMNFVHHSTSIIRVGTQKHVTDKPNSILTLVLVPAQPSLVFREDAQQSLIIQAVSFECQCMQNVQINNSFRLHDPIFYYLSSLLLQTEQHPGSAVVVGSQILHAQNVAVSVEGLCRGSSITLACSCRFVVKFAVTGIKHFSFIKL